MHGLWRVEQNLRTNGDDTFLLFAPFTSPCKYHCHGITLRTSVSVGFQNHLHILLLALLSRICVSSETEMDRDELWRCCSNAYIILAITAEQK
jgi:hypothetical protein